MDDERVVNRLRKVADPASPDPAFLERMYEELAGELRFRPARRRAARSSRSRMARRLALLAAAVVLTLSMVGGALLVGAVVDRQRTPDVTPSLLERIRDAGVVRIAVRSDFPQVTVEGTFQGGFDADVGAELANRLGVRPAVQAVDIEALLDPATVPSWDIALPSRSLTSDELTRLEASVPYYEWPVYLLVASSSTAASPADLAGQSICVVKESAGAEWLAGGAGIQTASVVAPPPLSAVPIEKASDADCIRALDSGEATAAVSATLSPSDLVARPSIRAVGEPVFLEERRIVVASGPDSPDLVAEINRLLLDLRSDGTLADLSRRRFGGNDLSPTGQ